MTEIDVEASKKEMVYLLQRERIQRTVGIVSLATDLWLTLRGDEEAGTIHRKILGELNELSHGLHLPDSANPLVPSYVVLKFDPTSTKEPKLKKVWANPIARTLWIAKKWRHLTNQYFNDECLQRAAWIKKTPPKTDEDLRKLVGSWSPGSNFPSHSNGQDLWVKELLPYVIGQKQIGYRWDGTW